MRSDASGESHPYRLGRPFSLGRNKYYQQVYRRGKSFPGRYLVVVYLKARGLKVGFSASAKVGGAVTRNRLRRWMREDFRQLRPDLIPGKYIIAARKSAVNVAHASLAKEMEGILTRAEFLRREGRPQ